MAESVRHDNDLAAWCVHGGRLGDAARAFPEAPLPWIDLSTGINPHGWDAARAGKFDWRTLPEPTALDALEAVAAGYFGVPADHVCAVPGTELGLRLLDTLGLPGPVRHVAPGYATHAAAARDRAITPEALAAEAERGGTILLANPNNPDGRIWHVETLIAIASRLAMRGGVLVVDEAFADIDPAIGLLPVLPENLRGNVVVLRSFGKFFGLAGLRLGFVCASPERLAPLRHRLGSWPLSAAAIAIGTVAYSDEPWITAMRARLRDDAARLDAMLADHGLLATGGCPLFRLVDSTVAPEVFARLARHGILTRPFDYAYHWLRFGLPGNAAGWARLEQALGDG